MNQTMKQTLIELIAGIVIYGIFVSILVMLIMTKGFHASDTVKIQVLVGLICGYALAIFMAVHMARSLETAVDLGEEGALAHTRKTYMIRTTIVMVAAVVLYLLHIADLIAVFGGLFSLKAAAYMQPLLHKISGKGGKEHGNDTGGR